jgi:chemotaxis protein CheD
MDYMIKVGMADLNVSNHPGALTTLGLGSCIGIALYDKSTKIIGLAHIMLPDSTMSRNNSNIAKFADTAIDKLLNDMIRLGARKESITAKIAGGSQMFAFNQSSDMMRIGFRNAVASKERLQQLRIPIIAEDTGGTFGRTIELYSDDGRLVIKTIGHGLKAI